MVKVIDFDNQLSDKAMEIYLFSSFVFYLSDQGDYYWSPNESSSAECVFLGSSLLDVNDFLESFSEEV